MFFMARSCRGDLSWRSKGALNTLRNIQELPPRKQAGASPARRAFPYDFAFPVDLSADMRRVRDFSHPIAHRAQGASGVGASPVTHRARLYSRNQAHSHTPFSYSDAAS